MFFNKEVIIIVVTKITNDRLALLYFQVKC